MLDQNKTKEELITELQQLRSEKTFLATSPTSFIQEIYVSAFNAVTQGIVVADSKQLITYINPAFETITGYSLQECIGRNCRFLQGKKTDEEVIKKIRKALSEGRNFSGEILNYRKDGSPFWNDLTISTVSDENGRITHFVGITRDITQRKEAERVLVRNNKLLEKSQSIAKLGGWELDLVNNRLYWTSETYRIHDTSPAEFNPTVDAGVSYFLPDSKQQIEQGLEQAMLEGIGYDLELETYTTKGRLITVRTTCDVTMEDGKPTKLTGIFQDITDKKAAELKLLAETEKAKANEKKFRTLFEQSSVGVAQIDLKTGRFFKVNKKYADILGYSIEEMRHLDFQSITYQEDVETSLNNLHAILKEEINDFVSEKRHIHKDGHLVWVDLSVSVISKEGRSPEYTIAVMTDITKRKKAEQQHEFERLDKEALINSTSDFIWSVGKDYELIAANNAFIEVVRKDQGVTLVKNDILLNNQFFSEEIIQNWQKIYHQAFAGNVVYQEFQDPEKDVWYELTINPIWKNGKVEALACFEKNITAQKKAQLHLTQYIKELTDYKFALDQSAIIAIADRFGNITYANDFFCNISKYPFEELIGQNHRILKSGYHSNEFYDELWTTISKGKIWRGEVKNKAKDGTFYWVDTTIVPFVNEENQPTQYMSIRFDITTRKEAELLVEAQNAELIKTNTELDRFVYSTSHDLRAPLKTMLGLIHILNQDMEDKALLEILTMMNQTVLKLDKFIGDVLDYSRNTRLDISNEEIDFEKLINEIKIEINTGDFHVDLIVENELNVKFYSDKARLYVILNNLISNSAQYLDPKKKSFIRLKLYQFSEYIVIEVEDNGIGIETKYIDKVFRMFYRATTLSSGSGLGLYIVKETVHKLEGSVALESKVGIGTKVIVQLPNQKK